MRAVATALAALCLLTTACQPSPAPRATSVDSLTVALGQDGRRESVLPGAAGQLAAPPVASVAPTPAPAADPVAVRALDPASRTALADWLGRAPLPGSGTPWQPMVRDALLDLRVLTALGPPTRQSAESPSADGGVAAGWSRPWRYVWPRDASFAAAALAAAGHDDDAERVLAFLQRVQGGDGTFQARYLLDGRGGVPDARGVELDGSGWVLWATEQVLARTAPTSRPARLQRLRHLVERAAAACAREATRADGLPPPSLDYWEVTEGSVTLGTAAPLLAGLRAAQRLLPELGETAAAGRAGRTADRLAQTLTMRFALSGWPRRVDGQARDAAVTFVMPPYQDGVTGTGVDRGLREAWLAAQVELARPGGGLAPGGEWPQDGVSWTPETALFALSAAAGGDRAGASSRLDWLSKHRTSAGSLPEKVLADGSPAAVAPLAWTAALVVLTVDALDRTSAAGP